MSIIVTNVPKRSKEALCNFTSEEARGRTEASDGLCCTQQDFERVCVVSSKI